MGDKSSIEWTEATWNPVTGCTKISEGCDNCYAERLSKRLKAMGQPNYANGFKVALHPHALQIPLNWKKPRTIFVNSMSDLFHKDVPDKFIHNVFDVMNQAHWHRFQVLTKRSSRLMKIADSLKWTNNIWMGVTIENVKSLNRLQDLKRVPCALKFLSLEPLLGPIPKIDLTGIQWVIVGGESGPHSRPMNEEWILEIQKACSKFKVPFFFKQWGGTNKKKAGRLLNGKKYDEMPVIAVK